MPAFSILARKSAGQACGWRFFVCVQVAVRPAARHRQGPGSSIPDGLVPPITAIGRHGRTADEHPDSAADRRHALRPRDPRRGGRLLAGQRARHTGYRAGDGGRGPVLPGPGQSRLSRRALHPRPDRGPGARHPDRHRADPGPLHPDTVPLLAGPGRPYRAAGHRGRRTHCRQPGARQAHDHAGAPDPGQPRLPGHRGLPGQPAAHRGPQRRQHRRRAGRLAPRRRRGVRRQRNRRRPHLVPGQRHPRRQGGLHLPHHRARRVHRRGQRPAHRAQQHRADHHLHLAVHRPDGQLPGHPRDRPVHPDDDRRAARPADPQLRPRRPGRADPADLRRPARHDQLLREHPRPVSLPGRRGNRGEPGVPLVTGDPDPAGVRQPDPHPPARCRAGGHLPRAGPPVVRRLAHPRPLERHLAERGLRHVPELAMARAPRRARLPDRIDAQLVRLRAQCPRLRDAAGTPGPAARADPARSAPPVPARRPGRARRADPHRDGPDLGQPAHLPQGARPARRQTRVRRRRRVPGRRPLLRPRRSPARRPVQHRRLQPRRDDPPGAAGPRRRPGLLPHPARLRRPLLVRQRHHEGLHRRR